MMRKLLRTKKKFLYQSINCALVGGLAITTAFAAEEAPKKEAKKKEAAPKKATKARNAARNILKNCFIIKY